MQTGTQRAQLGIVGNIAYQFTPNHRVSFENFYSHSGRDEGRYFEGPNFENNFYYRNYRAAVHRGRPDGERRLRASISSSSWSNSRIDWRVNVARASRDEPDLRETLYQGPIVAPAAGLHLYGSPTSRRVDSACSPRLTDDTVDASGNWSLFRTTRGPGDAVQVRRRLRGPPA